MAVWYHEKSTDESPDRDFKPVSWLPSPQGIYEQVYESQKFTLCTHSKFRLVEHSTIICNGKIQHQLLNQEYSFTITQRLSSTTHRKDREVFTQNALESPLLSQPDTTSFTKETYGFKSTKNPPSIEELKDFEDDMLKMIQSVKIQASKQPLPQ